MYILVLMKSSLARPHSFPFIVKISTFSSWIPISDYFVNFLEISKLYSVEVSDKKDNLYYKIKEGAA